MDNATHLPDQDLADTLLEALDCAGNEPRFAELKADLILAWPGIVDERIYLRVREQREREEAGHAEAG